MDSKKGLTLVSGPDAYFRELISLAMKNQGISAEPETEFYLVKLLGKFIFPENLTQEPLVFQLRDALEAVKPEHQVDRLRQVGDESLYVAGYFSESLNRKLVDIGYYIDMGCNAYGMVADRESKKPRRETFVELAEKFPFFVNVLAEVSEKTLPKSEQDLLRVYENWVETRSARDAEKLQRAGIIPDDQFKKKFQ